MEYVHQTVNTCAKQIKFTMEGNIINNIQFTGGCDGNLKAIPKLIEGW